jgi:hypothetical protein
VDTIRFIEQRDVDGVLALETRHAFRDPDFDVDQLPDHAWRKGDLMGAIRQYRNRPRAVPDTRTFVVESDGELTGCVCYELRDEGYNVLLFTARDDGARKVLLQEVVNKLAASETRSRLTMTVADGDWDTLKYLMNNDVTGDSRKEGEGVRVKLEPDPSTTGCDTWAAEYTVRAHIV